MKLETESIGYSSVLSNFLNVAAEVHRSPNVLGEIVLVGGSNNITRGTSLELNDFQMIRRIFDFDSL